MLPLDHPPPTTDVRRLMCARHVRVVHICRGFRRLSCGKIFSCIVRSCSSKKRGVCLQQTPPAAAAAAAARRVFCFVLFCSVLFMWGALFLALSLKKNAATTYAGRDLAVRAGGWLPVCRVRIGLGPARRGCLWFLQQTNAHRIVIGPLTSTSRVLFFCIFLVSSCAFLSGRLL